MDWFISKYFESENIDWKLICRVCITDIILVSGVTLVRKTFHTIKQQFYVREINVLIFQIVDLLSIPLSTSEILTCQVEWWGVIL